MSATLESLDYFQGSEVYGQPTARAFHAELKASTTDSKDPMPTVLIVGGKTLSAKTRLLLIEAELLAKEGVIVRPPVQWAESIRVAKDFDLLSSQTQFGELRGRDYESPTMVFENSLLALIRQSQGRNELISGDSPLYTGVPFDSAAEPNVDLSFFYGRPVANTDQEFHIDIKKLVTGANRAWTTARRLFLHQHPFDKFKYRAFLIGASATVDLRIQGLAKRVALHRAQTESEQAQALEGIGYHIDDITELMRNPARVGGPLKAVIAVDRDMDEAARNIVNIQLVMPPHGYRSEGDQDLMRAENAPKTTELMVNLNGHHMPFREAMERNPYYRLEVDRQLTLPISAQRFFHVPAERCLLSLLHEYDPNTVLDGNLLAYPGEYLKDVWRSSWLIDKVA